MKHTAALLLLAAAAPAAAHPFSTDTYSLANALQIGDSGVTAIVILEVPVPVVLADVTRRIEEGAGKKKALKDHDNQRFDDMAKGLSLSIDGQAQELTWRPVEHPSNGKAAEGFFLYWVGAKVPINQAWSKGVDVTLTNTVYGTKKMVYTGMAESRQGWTISTNSATDVLGVDVSTLGKQDTRAWSDNVALRALSVRWTKTP